MTTIVYQGGVLAADSQSDNGGWCVSMCANKLLRSADGRLFAVTGDYAEALTLAKWLAQPKGDRPKMGDQARVIEITRTGHILVHEGPGHFEHRGKFGAWGSGMPPAMAALHMGATAKTAVRIAMKVDPNSGGRVQSMRLKPHK